MSNGAALHWPGSGRHLVAVFECLAAERRGGLGAAVKISAVLQCVNERSELLAGLRKDVDALASSRKGPKADRHAAAIAALDALVALAARPVP